MRLGVISLMLLLSCSVGCSRLNRTLWGKDSDEKGVPVHEMFLVSCCRINNEGILTYPPTVPQSHANFCEQVRVACHGNDCQINGATYLPMNTDCGTHPNWIGDQYY